MNAAEPFVYKRYLASREWALLKRAVAKRSGGVCERCHFRQAAEVDHVTYERIGHERLEDLRHICRPCHKFRSAITSFDPAKCDCDPYTAQEWADLMIGEPPAVYGAALRHMREVTDAYQ